MDANDPATPLSAPYTMKFIRLLSALLLTGPLLAAQTPVDTAQVVSIGGIRQYITMQGKDRSLPLLLFLHGGPGGSVMHYADKFTDRLQEHFVVVQWDQRETGRTLQLNRSNVPLSLALFQTDTHALIDTLLGRFGRQKLYLVGHSWGTTLGFHMAENHPDILYAYVAIGPMIHQVESERVALARMQDHALKERNLLAKEQLSSVRIPFQNGEQLYYHRNWLRCLSGSRKVISKDYVGQWAHTWLKTFNEASARNVMQTLPEIRCPIYFFAGRTDYQTNSSIAEKYYLVLKAPRKGFFWFERSGHSIPSSEPERMQSIIIDTILPETFTIQKAGALISNQ